MVYLKPFVCDFFFQIPCAITLALRFFLRMLEKALTVGQKVHAELTAQKDPYLRKKMHIV